MKTGTAPPVSPHRLVELDLVRGLAILFMVLVHVVERLSAKAVTESPFGKIVAFLGGMPAAPVFIFLMGIGLSFSRRRSPGRLLRRGALLICLGYALSFCRLFAPV